jgi:hypothetical protein
MPLPRLARAAPLWCGRRYAKFVQWLHRIPRQTAAIVFYRRRSCGNPLLWEHNAPPKLMSKIKFLSTNPQMCLGIIRGFRIIDHLLTAIFRHFGTNLILMRIGNAIFTASN